MELKLRSYQQKASGKLLNSVNKGNLRNVVVIPCRGGKTPFGIHHAATVKRNGGQVLWNVHRTILLEQTMREFYKFGFKVGMISPNFKRTENQIQLASIQTVHKYLDEIVPPNLIISDECHRDAAKTRKKIIERFPNTPVIGLTGTPCRSDNSPLGDIYNELILGPSVTELIKLGNLCDYDLYCPPSLVNSDGVPIGSTGEYNMKQLAKVTDEVGITGNAIEHWKRIIPNKSTAIFCVNIEHAEHVAEQYRKAGIPTEAIHSKMKLDDIKKIVFKFRSKQIIALTNVDIITEGFDCPGIDAVQLLRKTNSLSLHLQMSTRCMTPSIYKRKAFIIDHVGNSENPKLGYVDDTYEWSLDSFDGVCPHEYSEKEINNKTCSKCWMVYPVSQRACPVCGNDSVKQRSPIDIKRGELVKIKHINRQIRERIGDVSTSKKSLDELQELKSKMENLNVPPQHNKYIAVLKRIDTIQAKTPEEIIKVAAKWNYQFYWAVGRYRLLNRFCGMGMSEAIHDVRLACNQMNLKLK